MGLLINQPGSNDVTDRDKVFVEIGYTMIKPPIRVKLVRILVPELLGVVNNPRVDRYYSTLGDDPTAKTQASTEC
jgi:hypothetical protein